MSHAARISELPLLLAEGYERENFEVALLTVNSAFDQ
jgi:hypothetical protein